MNTSKITQLFVQDIHAKYTKSIESGSSFVRLPTEHLGALLELLADFEMAAGQASRPRMGDPARVSVPEFLGGEVKP